jgi:hypothetical protein
MLAEDRSRQAEQAAPREDAALGRARNYGVELLREILKE